jgi:DNA phosphorothioation-associated putative methyltransferase
MKRDIKELFTDYPTAKKHAKDLLFSVSNSELLKTSCIRAQSKGIGYMFGNHSFQLHTSLISQLSPVLRVYVGCATQVFGDIDKVDLVKIHLQSKKVSLMIYDDFLTNPVPKLRTRIKINLLEQKIDFFDYENQKMQLLYLKSRYLHSSMPIYEEQKKFDEHLLSLNLFDFSRFGPTAEDFFYKFGHVDS